MSDARQRLLDALAVLEALGPRVGGQRDTDTWKAAWERAWREAVDAAKAYAAEDPSVRWEERP